ncbi:MAG: oligosaccharide flippase family protein [Candidatus Cloacimonadales bacterium]
MAGSGLRKTMIANTISNYGKLVTMMIVTIFLTRTLFLGLSREEYGLWALLWSIFGYSLLLDFGFGAAIQKSTSQTIVTEDWHKYNRLLSTVFFNYSFLAILIAAVSFFLAGNLQNMFQFSANSDLLYYKKIFIMFGVGTAVVFPSGFFVEVLRGLHKIKLRNNIQIIFNLLNFGLMLWVIHSGLALWGMTIVTIGTALLTNIVMAFYSYKSIPTLKISFKLYDFKLLKEVMSFSLFAYIISFSNLIIYQTDQLVISVFASVSLIAVYQISSKLAMTFKTFASQFLDNLAPVAATLFASNQEDKLGKIMIESNRLMGVISTLMFVPLVVFVRPLLKIWLELDDADGQLVAVLLLLSMYLIVFFRSTSVKILLMGNHYRKLSIVAIIECAMNLGLSIYLIRYYGIIGVALGTLIPNAILTVSFNIPLGLKFSQISLLQYFRQSVLHSLWIGALTLLFALGLKHYFYPENFLTLLLLLALTSLFFILVYYRFGTYKWERAQFQEFISRRFKK